MVTPAMQSSALNPLVVRLRIPRASADAAVSPVSVSAEQQPRAKHEDHSDSSSSESRSRAKGVSDAKARGRKPTYAVRKEEKELLLRELHELEERLEMLRRSSGLATHRDQELLDKSVRDNELLHRERRSHALALCGIQSELGQQIRREFGSPLALNIRLGKDMAQRRHKLLSMRSEKLDVSHRFLHERFRGVDPRFPYNEQDSWTTTEGDFCVRSSNVIIFDGVHSVKQVFDACLFYVTNMEISISEELGQLTLREDLDCIDVTTSNHRLVSRTDHGVLMEVNSVFFGEYYDRCDEQNGEEYAILMTETVTDDELYPYQPLERARKDLVGVMGISAYPKPVDTVNGPSHEMVVVLRRAAYLSIRKPEFDLSAAALTELHESIATWGHVMSKVIRDYVYASNSRSAS